MGVDRLLVTLLADDNEGDRQRRLAQAHLDAYRAASTRARHHEHGDRGEEYVRDLLAPLADEGWRLLHRRRWPHTQRADLDHVLVGPGGVLVLDTKHWGSPVRFTQGRLLLSHAEDATGAVDKLVKQVTAVEDVLAADGLAPLEVTGALVFVDQRVPLTALGRVHALGAQHLLSWLRARGTRLDPGAVAALAARLEVALPPVPSDLAPPVAIVRRQPKARTSMDGQTELFAATELDLADVARAARQPLEQWMVYLHPAQLGVVRRGNNGPSRIRGAAGCGKTVVALHRAAYLAAHEPGELLFLSYVKTLPVVLAQLYRRLSPHTADRVTFSGVHALALQIVRDAGERPGLDRDVAGTCFARAWSRVGRQHLGLPYAYCQEEVAHVIKGRGLEEFEQYADLVRTGRRTPLSAEQRRRVWDLYVEYQRLLHDRGVQDFEDVLALALEVARGGHAKTYRFVLVDEAQDLDLNAVRLAAALASEPRDGLTLVGDGQQAVYPGGFTLKEAGLSVTGRSTVLNSNYRNTRQILEAAYGMVRADDFDDLEELAESGDRKVAAFRDGGQVLRVTAPDPASAEVALVARLQHDAALGLPHADAAVLCRTVSEAGRYRRLLLEAGVPVQDLTAYDGTPTDAVKVGTVKRAKGLEFGRVHLPRVEGYRTQDGAAEPERVQRERRELFVAMTRARDGLWLCRVH